MSSKKLKEGQGLYPRKYFIYWRLQSSHNKWDGKHQSLSNLEKQYKGQGHLLLPVSYLPLTQLEASSSETMDEMQTLQFLQSC